MLPSTSAAILERFRIPVVLFAENGSVISCSSEAREILKSEAPDVLAELSQLARAVGGKDRQSDIRETMQVHEITRPNWEHVLYASFERASLGSLESCSVCALAFMPRKERVRVMPFRRSRHDVERVLGLRGLSPRERAVAHEILTGATSLEIADRLQITVHTVRRHTEKVLSKLQVSSRVAVAHVVGDLLDRGADAPTVAA